MDFPMEIVQANTNAMLIIESNDECMEYIRVPSAYQEVSYISRNGNNYIDTEWIPNLTIGYKVEIGYQIDSSGYRYIIASSYDGTDNNNGFEINAGGTSSNKLRYLIKGTTFEMFSNNSMSVGSFNNIVFESSGTSKKATLNGTTTQSSYNISGSFGKSLYLFVDRDLRWSTFNHNSKCSYFKIYENGVLIKDFIPCYRKSDNVIGFWESVNRKFYINKGTGTFAKGPNI